MRDWFRRFMQGRYGVDHFSHFLVILAFLLMFIQLFIHHDVLRLIISVLVMIILIFSYYRTFSRNHYQRYRENEWYLKCHNSVKYFFSRIICSRERHTRSSAVRTVDRVSVSRRGKERLRSPVRCVRRNLSKRARG